MKTTALVLLTLASVGHCQKIFEGESSAAHYQLGSAAYADIKNLQAIANQYFNNICHQNNRGDNCYKWVDLD